KSRVESRGSRAGTCAGEQLKSRGESRGPKVEGREPGAEVRSHLCFRAVLEKDKRDRNKAEILHPIPDIKRNPIISPLNWESRRHRQFGMVYASSKTARKHK